MNELCVPFACCCVDFFVVDILARHFLEWMCINFVKRFLYASTYWPTGVVPQNCVKTELHLYFYDSFK